MKRSIRAAAGVVLMVMLSAMYAWSYFKVALGDAYPLWTQKQITLNFTILMSCFCLGGLFAGTLLKRLSKSRQLVLSACMMGLGFLGVSLLPERETAALIQMYICYGVLNGLGTGIAYNAVLSGVQPWFGDKPGLISGILLMGMGIGTLLLGNGAAWLTALLGIKATFRLFALVSFVVLLVCSPAIRLPEQEAVGSVSGDSSAGTEEAREYTTAEMLRRPTFWVYFLWNILISASGLLVINSASSISLYYGMAAVVGLVVSLFNGGGRLAIGACMDRLGWKNTMYLNNGILLFAGILLCIGDKADSGAVILAGMLCIGVCYGGGVTISAALIRRLYGSENYASNFSVCNLCGIPASMVGPMISAALQDGSGNYTSTFVMVVILGVVTMLLNLTIRRP